ncbi:MAG: site-specific integrase [Calditrichaceae bacterium]
MDKANNVLSIKPQNEQKKSKKWSLKEHLASINENAAIRLRVKKAFSGRYYFYLELNRGGKQEKEFLGIYYEGKRNTKRADKEALTKAEQIQKKRDSEYFQNKFGFRLMHENQKMNFLKFFEHQIKDRSKSDQKNWRHTLRHLTKFTRNKNITFLDMTTDFCEKFAEYLKSNLSANTANEYFGKLKTCLNIAVKKNILIKSPAQFVTISKIETQREFLTFGEIQKLNQTSCANEQTKRAFLFSCFTGLRISDIKKLIWKEVQGEYINFIQKKTSGVQRLKLSATANEIIITQRVEPIEPENKVFNLIAENKALAHLKKWTAEAGINKNIGWHTGRHTFACLALASGVDIYTVSKLLGHKDVRVTQIYAKLIDSDKDKAIDRLPKI